MEKQKPQNEKHIPGMVDVGNKKETNRIAKAQAVVKLKKEVIDLIKNRKVIKGDVLETARMAGIMAAKKTPHLIPLCHPLRLNQVKISYSVMRNSIRIESWVQALERTGVEMEALVSCAICALTIYDMCKMYDKSIQIEDLMVLEKRGGKSGTFIRKKT